MKNKLIAILTICLCVQIATAQNTVTLSGKLKNFSNQVEVEDMSDFQYLIRPSADRMIVADASGNFTITFNLAAPNYFRIGRNIVYLSPGDNLKVVIDKDNAPKGSFSGTNEEAQRYLCNTLYPSAGSFLEAGSKIQPSAKETFDVIMAAAQYRTEQLASIKKISPEFRRLEEARIKADVLNSFSMLTGYAKSSTTINAYPVVYMQSFNNLSARIKAQYQHSLVDASLMKLAVYRNVARDIINNAPENDEVTKIQDWFTASNIIEEMRQKSDKASLAAYDQIIEKIKTPAYNAAVKTYLQGLLQFGKGDPAVDFTAIDMAGKPISLADLKGKVIYVDIWATWCGPCMAEMPSLDMIKEKYKNNKDVVFVSLSIDDDKTIDRWKQSVRSRKALGYQWQINRNKLNPYNVTNIPRSLLIDKDLKIVSMSAPLPSSLDLPNTIDKLLN